MPYILGEIPTGHLLPVNPIATVKTEYREVPVRGRHSETVALQTETRYKAYSGDKVAKSTKVQIGNRNLHA